MELKYRKSQSSIKPELLDTTSSKTSVYLRKDIVEKTVTDMDGNETIMYEYDEAVLSNAEYEDYKKDLDVIDIQKLRSDIDAILKSMNMK